MSCIVICFGRAASGVVWSSVCSRWPWWRARRRRGARPRAARGRVRARTRAATQTGLCCPRPAPPTPRIIYLCKYNKYVFNIQYTIIGAFRYPTPNWRIHQSTLFWLVVTSLWTFTLYKLLKYEIDTAIL